LLRRRQTSAIRAAIAAGLAACSAAGSALPARATSRDFIDETLVSQPFKPRELGLEIGAESRLDIDYRVQGWYRAELEFAPAARWFLEGVAQGVSRGQGLELGGWILGTRLRLLSAEQAWVDVTAVVEYEVETDAAKHPDYERILVPRLAFTRQLGARFDLTADLGAASRLQPSPSTGFAYGFGARFNAENPLACGIELVHEPTEGATRLTPQLWIRLPGEARLRLGGAFELEPVQYRFVARAILETEFD
jgi:hypothetical protein